MAEFVTPDLCDAHEGTVRVCEPVFTNFGARRSFGGEIVTIKCFEDNTLVKQQANAPGTGKVMVVDGGGSLRCALLGDMIAAAAADNGWEGIIIHGCIRDVDEIAKTNLGVQALRAIPVKSVRRGEGQLNIPVTFAWVTFAPGQYVYADNNGVIVAPEKLAAAGGGTAGATERGPQAPPPETD